MAVQADLPLGDAAGSAPPADAVTISRAALEDLVQQRVSAALEGARRAAAPPPPAPVPAAGVVAGDEPELDARAKARVRDLEARAAAAEKALATERAKLESERQRLAMESAHQQLQALLSAGDAQAVDAEAAALKLGRQLSWDADAGRVYVRGTDGQAAFDVRDGRVVEVSPEILVARYRAENPGAFRARMSAGSGSRPGAAPSHESQSAEETAAKERLEAAWLQFRRMGVADERDPKARERWERALTKVTSDAAQYRAQTSEAREVFPA